jgi:hypothetical protein
MGGGPAPPALVGFLDEGCLRLRLDGKFCRERLTLIGEVDESRIGRIQGRCAPTPAGPAQVLARGSIVTSTNVTELSHTKAEMKPVQSSPARSIHKRLSSAVANGRVNRSQPDRGTPATLWDYRAT